MNPPLFCWGSIGASSQPLGPVGGLGAPGGPGGVRGTEMEIRLV